MNRSRREGSHWVEENARIRRGNDAIVRVCIIAFGLAIAAIVPVPWGWKIALFTAIMLFVGIMMPAVRRTRNRAF